MERLLERIGVEVPWAEVLTADAAGAVEEVPLERDALGRVPPLLGGSDPPDTAHLRFTTRLRPVENGIGPRLAAEPPLETLLDDGAPDDPAAGSLRDLLRLDEPRTLDVLRDPARVAPTERAVRAAVLAVGVRARLCAWEARELRPASPCTVIVEHGVIVEREGDRPPSFVTWGVRRLRLGEGAVAADEVAGPLAPAPDGAWLAVDGGAPRPAHDGPFEFAAAPPDDDPRERARRRALEFPWPEADARARHLSATLDAEEKATPARVKTLVRILGARHPDPLATVLFAEGLVPMHAVTHVLAPAGAARDARLRDLLRDVEHRLDALDPTDAFRLIAGPLRAPLRVGR